jgi:hypothetical protein
LDRPSNLLRRDKATVDVLTLDVEDEEEEKAKFHANFSIPLRDINLVISVSLHMSKKPGLLYVFKIRNERARKRPPQKRLKWIHLEWICIAIQK